MSFTVSSGYLFRAITYLQYKPLVWLKYILVFYACQYKDLQFYKNAECKPFSFILQSSSCFPYAVSIHTVILSRLVDTFSSRILYPMLLLSGKHSIAVAWP